MPSLTVDAAKPRQFSLDGELVERRHVELAARPRAMEFVVGEAYDRHPEENPRTWCEAAPSRRPGRRGRLAAATTPKPSWFALTHDGV
ncbi:hypothetical protein ACFQRB_00910 [Halobaculum litoreum]|uniref:Uncharacterized protein n=1 Tax=Halobaculum litoreum TaxID=3031998 RepID=A0ABD5XK88_9EURY